ncbi:GMC family oxidoreductase [Mucilaginibacter endophyticus]|uniref:GMC family oxidoreductase n=1 Tax=Mucilaginibacter endophyticus TaxID=2675003 RepID=UPI000E0CD89F|nr:GMC family oxidoreductase N-terminal domain-containing protein [Mucilaginibacter endophyticus]
MTDEKLRYNEGTKGTLPPIKNKYDFIIVGAGSAGCVIARRLADTAGVSVLLLEAGGSDAGIESIAEPMQWVHNIGAPHDYFYAYEPTAFINNRVIPVPRGKVLGGSGSINAITWTRGNQADYDGWAAAGNTGWDYNSVLPFFKKIEDWEGGATDFHGANGPIAIENAKNLHFVPAALIEAGRTYGMPVLEDTNGPAPEGVGKMVLNVRDGKRSSPTEYLKPVMDHDNLTILTHAKVLKLNFHDTHCLGLNFELNGEMHTVFADKEVILSAGAIDTPRILMLSGIGDSEELKKLGIKSVINLPGVGKNLQDHPLVAGLCFEANIPLGIRNNNLAGSTALWKSKPELQVPDLMYLPLQVPYLTHEIAQQYDVPENVFCLVPGLVRPKSKGYLKMKTARHDGPLEIQPNFIFEPEDLQALVAGVEIGMELISQPAFKNITSRWIAPKNVIGKKAIEGFIRDALTSYFHPVGTCKMGVGSDAVVDSQLKVHGITGLRIADASVMPTITSANTNAATMMIGEVVSQAIINGL